MDKKELSQVDKNELEELINDIKTWKDLAFAKSCINKISKKGYNADRFKLLAEERAILMGWEKDMNYVNNLYNLTKKNYFSN